jgi:transcriptional regulator with XRE-family HTH domain
MGAGQTVSGLVDTAGLDSQWAGPRVARVLLGGRLRGLREAREITREEAGHAIRSSPSKISRLELGRNGFKYRDVADLLTLYGVTDAAERAGLLALVEAAKGSGWLHEYSDLLSNVAETRLELEQVASVIRSYEPQFVPGVLQTRDYADAVLQLNRPDALPSEIERRVDLLVKHQELLRRPQAPGLWVVLDEAALRRRVGGAATMRHQLAHLIETTCLPNVTIQVMPFRCGVAAGGAISLLRFAEHELADVVYLDQPTSALQPDRPADICHYREVIDRLSVRAEPPRATAAIIRGILAEDLSP